MKDIKIMEQIMSPDNEDNIVLFDEDGNTVELEQIAVVKHDEKMYAILRHMDDAEDEVLVYLIDHTDEEVLIQVDDEKLATDIIDQYNKEQE